MTASPRYIVTLNGLPYCQLAEGTVGSRFRVPSGLDQPELYHSPLSAMSYHKHSPAGVRVEVAPPRWTYQSNEVDRIGAGIK